MAEIVELQPNELSDLDALKQIRAWINEDSRRLKFPSLGPTPEERAGEAMMARQIAEIFRKAGVPVIDFETGLELSAAWQSAGAASGRNCLRVCCVRMLKTVS